MIRSLYSQPCEIEREVFFNSNNTSWTKHALLSTTQKGKKEHLITLHVLHVLHEHIYH